MFVTIALARCDAESIQRGLPQPLGLRGHPNNRGEGVQDRQRAVLGNATATLPQ